MDDLGRLDTPLHRLDARVKILATAAFIAVVVSRDCYAVSALAPLALYPISLIAVGRLPARALARKALAVAPFAVLVGAFNPWFDRRPMAAIGPWTVSAGWISFLSILLRFSLTVTAALALVAVTGMYRLCAALTQLGMPRAFVTQLLLLYRYLFVVSEQAQRTHRAARLRAQGRAPRLRAFASMIAMLLLRALDRADRVYRAMRARGFDGQIRSPQSSRLRPRDVGFLAGSLAFFAAARIWNLAEIAGRLILRSGP